MSSPRKSHATAWLLILIAIPLVYLLSVPPILIKAMPRLGPRGESQEVTRFRATYTNFALSYSKPYRWLEHHPSFEGPLQAYFRWWWSAIGDPRLF